MSREIVQQLKALQHKAVNPRENWVAQNRAVLVSQIKNTVSHEQRIKLLERVWTAMSIFLPRTLVYNVVRPVVALLVIALVATTAYSGTVKASYETLPGDTLYAAKIFTEQIPVTVASLIGDNNTEVKLHIQIAKNRLAETKKILTGSDPRKKDQIGVTMTNLKIELNSVSQKLDGAKANPIEMKVDAVKDVSQSTQQIKNDLQDVKLNLMASASADDKVLSKEVSETKDLVKDVSVKAVEVMVNKHLEGDQGVSKEDVKEVINNSLQNNLSDVAESKQNVDGAKVIVDNINTEVKDLAAIKKTTPVSAESASSTKAFAAQISTVATQTNEAVAKTGLATIDADKKVKEAQQLLGNDDLLKAVDKVKEVAQVSKDAEKISDATLEKTQNVVPIVQVVKGVGPDSVVSTTVIVATNSKDTAPVIVSTTVITGGTSTTLKSSSTVLKISTSTAVVSTDTKK